MRRKHLDTEKFVKAYQEEGLSYTELANKFHISTTTVSERIKTLGLMRGKVVPETKELKKRGGTPKEKVEKPIVTSILPKLGKVQEERKQVKSNGFFIPPSLGELKRMQLQQKIERAENKYKISKRDVGYQAIQDEMET